MLPSYAFAKETFFSSGIPALSRIDVACFWDGKNNCSRHKVSGPLFPPLWNMHRCTRVDKTFLDSFINGFTQKLRKIFTLYQNIDNFNLKFIRYEAAVYILIAIAVFNRFHDMQLDV